MVVEAPRPLPVRLYLREGGVRPRPSPEGSKNLLSVGVLQGVEHVTLGHTTQSLDRMIRIFDEKKTNSVGNEAVENSVPMRNGPHSSPPLTHITYEGIVKWTQRDSNPRPPPCEGGYYFVR